ncbi:MAG: diguanylate cyclase, partial [Comamonas sp.]
MHTSFAREWRQLLQSYPAPIVAQMQSLAAGHAATLAQYFYEAMLEDPQASALLSHEQVHTRLLGSMQQWIQDVLGADLDADFAALVQRQVQIGQIHARIDVPVHLVLRGARRLKDAAHRLLQAEHAAAAHGACQLLSAILDHAMEAMSQAYAFSREDTARSQEAYRLFSVTENLSTVREQRRAELLAWENQCLYLRAMGGGSQAMLQVASSDFGLWFRHKGMDMFQGMPAAQAIMEAMQCIDEELLPALMHSTPENMSAALMALRDQTRHMAMNLEALFTQSSELDAGRDVLTQLLNRKFLPVVMTKEVAYARKTASVFSVLAIDIDHFKHINDRYGHEAGDAVLQQVAALMSNSIRGGDYLFRLGGEEFLMLLV